MADSTSVTQEQPTTSNYFGLSKLQWTILITVFVLAIIITPIIASSLPGVSMFLVIVLIVATAIFIDYVIVKGPSKLIN